jgi:hypothetical protein
MASREPLAKSTCAKIRNLIDKATAHLGKSGLGMSSGLSIYASNYEGHAFCVVGLRFRSSLDPRFG